MTEHKESACSEGNAGDVGLIPGLGRSPGGGHGNPLQYFCPENLMDRGAWQVTEHRFTKSQTRLKRVSTHAGMQLLKGIRSAIYWAGRTSTAYNQVGKANLPRRVYYDLILEKYVHTHIYSFLKCMCILCEYREWMVIYQKSTWLPGMKGRKYWAKWSVIRYLTLETLRAEMHSSVDVQSLSHVWLCDPMDCSMPGPSVLHCLPKFVQIHVHWVSDTI